MSVVLTGSAGFIGQHVLRRLIATGRDVVAIDRRPTPTTSPRVRVITADLLDHDLRVADALAHADGLIHLAGRPGVRDNSPGIEELRYDDNVRSTSAVLDAIGAEVPAIVASSSSVYGGSAGRASAESDALHPRGGYAHSKVQTERVCAEHLATGGRAIVVRPFTVLGAGQRPDMAVSRWALAAAEGRPITIYGSPDRTRDLTDVQELASALVDLLEVDHRGPLNLGSGRPHSLRALAAAVSRSATGLAAELAIEPAHVDDPAATYAETTLLRTVLGRELSFDLDLVVDAAVQGILGLRASLVS